ncbi:MAG: retroviral-like aspartic protease family protein [Bacteroidaceae bacterium]|nr:retroviral-like aspartic protease family protein [Bacteroidaceae bacterium]
MKREICMALTVVLMGCSGGRTEKEPESYNYKRGCEAASDGNTDEAMKYFQEEVDENPKNGYAWAWIQCMYRDKEEYGEALSAGAKALKYLPRRDHYYVAFTHATQAKVYYAMDETEKALGEVTKALKVEPKNEDYLSMRGGLLWEMDEYAKSNADYEKLIQLTPGATDGYMGKGRNLLEMAQYDEAIELFTYASKLDSDLSQAYSFRASAYLSKGNNHAAAQDIVKSLEMDGNNRSFFIMQDANDTCYRELVVMMKMKANIPGAERDKWTYYQGVLHQRQKHYHKAIESYKESAALEATAAVYENIADCYDQLGNYPMALRYIDLAIAQDSTDDGFIQSKADLLYNNGEGEKAVAEMSRFVERRPNFYGGYYRRGFFKDNMLDVDGAIEDYTYAITLKDDYAYAYLGRGDMYIQKGDTAAARADYEQAARLDSVIGKTGDCRQYALLMLGMPDSAEVHMKRILAQDSTAGNYYDAACLMCKMGRLTEALGYLQKSFEKGFRRFAHIERDDDLDALRGMEEYKAMIDTWKKKFADESNEDAENDILVALPETVEMETTEVPFKKEGSMMKISCTINDLPLHFIFDTGASDVSISEVEANFMLKNGYLTRSDVQGKAHYSTADGSVHEGTVLNLRHVKFGGLELNNVKASVVKSQKAPLLLGQSIFERLGRIEIDNESRVVKVTHKK